MNAIIYGLFSLFVVCMLAFSPLTRAFAAPAEANQEDVVQNEEAAPSQETVSNDDEKMEESDKKELSDEPENRDVERQEPAAATHTPESDK